MPHASARRGTCLHPATRPCEPQPSAPGYVGACGMLHVVCCSAGSGTTAPLHLALSATAGQTAPRLDRNGPPAGGQQSSHEVKRGHTVAVASLHLPHAGAGGCGVASLDVNDGARAGQRRAISPLREAQKPRSEERTFRRRARAHRSAAAPLELLVRPPRVAAQLELPPPARHIGVYLQPLQCCCRHTAGEPSRRVGRWRDG
eukprot:7325050-Prymnesium_polylepis.2